MKMIPLTDGPFEGQVFIWADGCFRAGNLIAQIDLRYEQIRLRARAIHASKEIAVYIRTDGEGLFRYSHIEQTICPFMETIRNLTL
jgi:hypothetical protein